MCKKKKKNKQNKNKKHCPLNDGKNRNIAVSTSALKRQTEFCSKPESF